MNPSKAEAAFGIKFTYELELWVKKCVEWYKLTEEFTTRSHIQSITDKNLDQ